MTFERGTIPYYMVRLNSMKQRVDSLDDDRRVFEEMLNDLMRAQEELEALKAKGET